MKDLVDINFDDETYHVSDIDLAPRTNRWQSHRARHVATQVHQQRHALVSCGQR